VYLGTFERGQFIDLGGYRTFPSGTVEDTDFYARWRSAGGTVLVDPSIQSWYRPRDTWRALSRQYVRYGRGKAELVWLNGRLPSLRPLAPAILVSAFGVFVIVGIVWAWIPLAALSVAWLTALGVVAVRAKTHRLRAAVAAGTMHISYGTGFWLALAKGRPKVQTLGLTEERTTH
jgi:succinoglycan biosynthesis protein ExoA